MVKLTRYEIYQKEKTVKVFKPLIDDLVQCDLPTFLEKIQSIKEWDRTRDDLYVWIPVLNRIDDLFANVVKKYNYATSDYKKNPAKLTVMGEEDVKLCKTLSDFTYQLLYNTKNRFIYSSMDVLNNLLNCPNFEVKLCAMKILAMVGERYLVARERIEPDNVLGNPNLKKKALKLALSLPSSAPGVNGEHVSLIDLYGGKKNIPEKWSKFKLTYYSTADRRNQTGDPEDESQPHTFLKRFTLTEEELRRCSLQELFDKGMKLLPLETWYNYSIRVTVAKAFSDNSPENLKLREYIVRTKFNAVAFVNTVFLPPQVSSKLFEIDPYVFTSLTDFMSSTEKSVPPELKLDALFALECISLKHIWCSHIMRNLGGNLVHGTLFHLLRQISKDMRSDDKQVYEEFNVRFFYLISNLADVKTLHDALLGAGLCTCLLDILSIRDVRYRRSVASATHLLEIFINDAESTAEFITDNGFNILINSITDQVNFALEHPELATPPKYTLEHYTISFRQQALIRSLLKLVLKLLKTDSGDRIRNLIDSPILGALRQILENGDIFGDTLISFALNIVQRVINNEPTIYPVLVEAGIIPYIIDNFSKFIRPSADLLFIIPDVISALCLNVDGLKKVKETNMIQQLFQCLTEVEYAQALSWNDEATEMGTSLDELGRHYPELKPLVLEGFCNMVKTLPQRLNFKKVFLYESPLHDEYFYHSKEEKVVNEEEGGGELMFWDTQESSSVIDCFSYLFYGMTLENSILDKIPEVLKVKELLPVLVLDKPPFDFTDSQAMLNITDVLQLFDEQNKDYIFMVLLRELSQRLKNISGFLNSDHESSYFLAAKQGADNSKINDTLGDLSTICSLLHMVTNVYLNIATLSPTRMLQIIEYFDENDYEFISNLGLLFKKAALEEMFIRRNLPDQVAMETTPDAPSTIPPLLIYASKPNNKAEFKDNGTSAKFKNTYEVRYLLNKLQSNSAVIFRCLLRLIQARNVDIELSDKSIEIHIFDTVVQQLVSMLDFPLNDSTVSYFLVLFNFVNYVLSFPKTTITSTETLQTVPALLFYQRGGYKRYVDLLIRLFSNLLSFKNVASLEEIDFIKDSTEVLTVSSIINILGFFIKSSQLEAMESGQDMTSYYPSLENECDISGTFSLYIKRLSLYTISRLKEECHIFELSGRSIPYTIYKQILSLITHAYTRNPSEEPSTMLELHWDLIPPSHRKMKLLSGAGLSEDVARAYLEENDDKLPKKKDLETFTVEEWNKYEELLSSHDADDFSPPVLADSFPSSTDLDELRSLFFAKDFETGVFASLTLYPKLVNSFAKMLLRIFECLDRSVGEFTDNLLNKIINSKLDDHQTLSSLLHLFGVIFSDDSVYREHEPLIIKYISYMQDILDPEHVNSVWFSKVLYVYELALSRSELPVSEELSEDIKLRLRFQPPLPVYHIPEATKQKLFNILIRVNFISNFYSAIGICRILLLYAKTENYSRDIIRSGILSKVLKVIGAFQKSDKIHMLEASYLLLVRRCFETSKYVDTMMKNELNKVFLTRTFGEHKEKKRDLTELVDEKSHIVLRDPKRFTELLCESTLLTDFAPDGTLTSFMLKRIANETPKAGETPVEVSDEDDRYLLNGKSGIVHLLLSQLMLSYRMDWLSEPTGKKNSQDNRPDRPDPARNPVCAYMIFLLKLLVELITSYKSCKFEFLTYDRRNAFTENPRPRSTALNFFLYQLLDKKVDTERSKHEERRRETISMLAKSVIIGFMSTVQDEKFEKTDPKKVDPDMLFIRKFTIELILKALKNATASQEQLEANVSKITSWLNILSLSLYVQAPYLRILLDNNKIENDRYQICKTMIELNVPGIITDCMSNIDLNYPFFKKLFNDVVEVLNAINTTRSDFSSLFKIESHDEDVDVEEESEGEEQTNIFRNSALSMYDVEDIEEDADDDSEDEDGSLIGDDEDEIAFVDNDGGFEVVFSEDDAPADESESMEADQSSEEDNNADIIINTDGDGMSIDIVEDVSDFSSEDDEESSYTSSSENSEDVEIVDVNPDEEYEIDFGDYPSDASDWESGLSDLSSDYGSDDSEQSDSRESDGDDTVRFDNVRRTWTLRSGIELEDDQSDEDTRGVFRVIEHIFNPEIQGSFRVQESQGNRRHVYRGSRRRSHVSLMPPSIALLGGNRRSQSNLVNPLGPSGLTQTENDISQRLVNAGAGSLPRSIGTHFGDVPFSFQLVDERVTEGIVLKSTVSRWKDIYEMFYGSRDINGYIIPGVLNVLYRPSLKVYEELQSRVQKESVEEAEDQEDSESQDGEQDEDEDHISHENTSEAQASEPHEAVYVTIDGTEVDIGGTDIDPEFLRALPEDMRAEVFAQHVRERRAEALQRHTHPREIDPDFLDAIPPNLRAEILAQEAVETRFSGLLNALGGSDQHDTEAHTSLNLDGEGGVADTGDEEEAAESGQSSAANSQEDSSGSQRHAPNKKKTERTYFEPLLDRQGIAALMKSIFISQPYNQREIYQEAFYRLCLSKQNRNDIINILLLILIESSVDQPTLDMLYNIICNVASRTEKNHPCFNRQLPADSTPLTIANQTIEMLQSLLYSDSRLKYFFITEHENLMINRPIMRDNGESSVRHERWPIRCLFSLLDRKIITDETVLMDLLTDILETCTKPISAMIKASGQVQGDAGSTKKKFQVPKFERNEFRQLVSIIELDSCSTKVFQQTLNVMHNLLPIKPVIGYFTEDLVKLAVTTSENLSSDLRELGKEVSKVTSGSELDPDLVQRLTVPSSNQAKLLKILTAVDYLYTHKKKPGELDHEKLSKLYNSMGLGKVWSPLSNCLSGFEKRRDLLTSATILLPSIESLMVVCKHSKISQRNVRVVRREDEEESDIAKLPVESLFFPFTDVHKKLLNQMIRSNPNLMSGPFSLLVKNPKSLDFDNKRYYFMTKIRGDSQDRPKLSISVRRDQVFLDSYRALFFKSNEEIRDSKLEITFKGESGVDAGGLTREWYQVLSRQMFNPDYALFLPVASDRTTFHPNRTSGINPEHLSFFKFIGMVIGKAIRDHCHLDCHFSRDVYKDILGKPVALKDVESLDPNYYKSLEWILENDITDVIEETFSVETDDYGEHKIVDLIENGRNIPVTESNKKEYVRKIVEYKLQLSVKDQMDNFLQGFYVLIPKELISIFDEQELELLISGLPDLDVDDWKNNTTYVNYTATSKQINYFWRAVRSFDTEERAKLLQFVTGTSKVPLNGFRELSGVSGVCKFSIHRDYGSIDRLPSSHTCFNQLNLPAYESYETLRSALLLAINEGHEGFGLA